MTDDWRVVFESLNRGACSDRALVLAASNIPHDVIYDQGGYAIVVPAEHSVAAARELWLYDEENPPAVATPPVKLPAYDAMPGVFGYVIVACLVGWLAATAAFSENWVNAGRVDGALMRNGEWWRAFTALTLHSGIRHLLGNLVFGVVFGLFAGRLMGSGVAWLAIIVSGAAGNVLNTLLLESTHRSIGASTAVFAALGIVAGFVWRGKLMSQERWSYRLGPVVGGLALLMYTGTGDANTDIGAHLMGFVSGFAGGMVLTRYRGAFDSERLQLVAGASAVAILAFAWLVAF